MRALQDLARKHERQLNGDELGTVPGLVTKVAIHEDQISGNEGLFALFDRVLSEIRHLRLAMYAVAVAVIGGSLGVILLAPAGGHP